MKGHLLTLAVLLAINAVCAYDEKYDNVDVEAFFNNETKVKDLFDCFVGNSNQCNGESQFLKEYLGEVIATNCAKCTPKQKEQVDKAHKLMKENYPEMYEQLVQKFPSIKNQ